MKKAFVWILVAAAMTAVCAQRSFSQELAISKDGNLTIFVHGVQSGSSFDVYAQQAWPSAETQITAHDGTTLVQVSVVVKNDSRTQKASFRVGDVQLSDGKKKLLLVAVGFSDKPAIVKPAELKKTENAVETADPTVYLFSHYIFEVPAESKAWNVLYKNKPLVDLKGKETAE